MFYKKSSDAGFTLIEILIALAIVAIGVGASLKATTLFSANAYDLKIRLFADWAAQNRLAIYRLEDDFPDLGQHRQSCPIANEAFTCISTVSSTVNPLVRRVEIRVVRPNDERNDYARLVATLLQPQRR